LNLRLRAVVVVELVLVDLLFWRGCVVIVVVVVFVNEVCFDNGWMKAEVGTDCAAIVLGLLFRDE